MTAVAPFDAEPCRAHARLSAQLLVPGVRQDVAVFERFTEAARQVVVASQAEARSLGHGHIGTKHLLLGLEAEQAGIASQVLAGLGATLARTRALVVEHAGSAPAVTTGQIPFTPGAKQALECSLLEAKSLAHNYIAPEHVLLGLIRVDEGLGARLLARLGLDTKSIRGAVLKRLADPDYAAVAERGLPGEQHRQTATRFRAQVLASQRARPGSRHSLTRQSAETVERFYALQRRFYAGDDVTNELTEVLAEDVIWHVPGRSAIAGEYRGREQALSYFAKRRAIADATFRMIPRGMLVDAERVVHFADGEATIGGQTRSWRTVGIFQIGDGRIAECWLLPFDQYEFDEIWSSR